jgi:hypothetical protein
MTKLIENMKAQSEKGDMFVTYSHHNEVVWTRLSTRGLHRMVCLCYSCKSFKPETPANCPIAQRVYETCLQHNLTTPVFECPKFEFSQETENHFLEE